MLRLRRQALLLVQNRRFRSKGRGAVDPKFQAEGVVPTNRSFSQKSRLNDLSYGVKILTDFSFVLSQFTRLTDRQADRILIAKPRLHSMQRGKNGAAPALMLYARILIARPRLHSMQRGKNGAAPALMLYALR